MKREVHQLGSEPFDLLVVGAGVYGICAAWDAAQRGLRVALVDRGDFCSATSANSLKIAHGGLRYLQTADLRRMRHSIRERTTLFRIAPHLVRPLPCVMPTRRRPWSRTRVVLGGALAANELASFGRNRGLPARSRLPAGGLLGPEECAALFPSVDLADITGGALWYDGLIHNPERLALSWLHKAVAAGVRAANYLAVDSLATHGNRVVGGRGRDLISGEELEIRAEAVLACCGPWSERFLERSGSGPAPRISLASAVNLLVRRSLSPGHALAIGKEGDRLFFLVPWRGLTMIGTSYEPHSGDAQLPCGADEQVERFLAELEKCVPDLGLEASDVALVHLGLVPCEEKSPGAPLRILDRPRLVDCGRDEGPEGLVSVMGVKWTTARAVAERAVDLVCRRLRRKAGPCQTASTPVHGGECGELEDLVRAVREREDLDDRTSRHIAENYGTCYRQVTRYMQDTPGTVGDDSTILRAEVLHAAHEEMVETLADVVFRRTGLGTAGNPGEKALLDCARLTGGALSWSRDRTEAELTMVRKAFPYQGSR